MQRIRGFIHFEDKSIEEVSDAMIGIGFDDVDIRVFRSVHRRGEEVLEPGIFIDGVVSDDYSSESVVRLIREKIGLEGVPSRCDLSIESEDTIRSIMNGDLNGVYVGIRILPPYDIDRSEELAGQMGKITGASNVLIRTVESVDGGPALCIDLISMIDPADYEEGIERLMSEDSLIAGKTTFIQLEQ